MHTNYDTITVISVHATTVTCNVIKCIDIYIYRQNNIIFALLFSPQVGKYVSYNNFAQGGELGNKAIIGN